MVLLGDSYPYHHTTYFVCGSVPILSENSVNFCNNSLRHWSISLQSFLTTVCVENSSRLPLFIAVVARSVFYHLKEAVGLYYRSIVMKFELT